MMEMIILKPKINSKFHFGEGSLEGSNYIFHSNSLFSAIANNYIKIYGEDEDFEKIKNDLKKTLELNGKLEEPFGLKEDKKLENEIESEMNSASEKLKNKKQKRASENQKNAGEKIKEMKDALQAAFESEMEARMGEDEQNMKSLMDNLVQLSFQQEKSIENIIMEINISINVKDFFI